MVLLCLGWIPGGWAVDAAVPTVDHFFPPALQRGTTNLVKVMGKVDPWPGKVWADDPGLRFVATTNKGELLAGADLSVSEGPHWVRIYNDEGASRPRCFVVDRSPQTAEVEPNDEWKSPQRIAGLPAVINGRLEKAGDVDSFGVVLAAGQTLVAGLEAYVLESPVDAVLRVTDAQGAQLAWNHDGRTLDPFLTFTAPAAGPYVVQVMGFPHPATAEIRFYGNERCVYRLRLDGGPCGGFTLPLGARRGVTNRLHVVGWNLPADFDADTELVVPTMGRDWLVTTVRVPGLANAMRVPLGDGPEMMEAEPNDRAEAANALEVPGAATGALASGLDVDRYRFQAKKGERLVWAMQSASLGFALDGWIRVENSNGVQVARSEGGNGVDPELSWTAGGDGTFQVVVGSLIHRGGSNQWYRLAGRRAGPDFDAAVAAESFVFKAGTTNDVKLTVNRLDGLTNRLAVKIEGWPSSVTTAGVDVPEKGGEVTLRASVAADAPGFGGPFRIVISDPGPTGGNRERARAARYSYVSTTENNGVPGGFRELLLPFTESLWLTVRPAEPATSSPGGAKK